MDSYNIKFVPGRSGALKIDSKKLLIFKMLLITVARWETFFLRAGKNFEKMQIFKKGKGKYN